MEGNELRESLRQLVRTSYNILSQPRDSSEIYETLCRVSILMPSISQATHKHSFLHDNQLFSAECLNQAQHEFVTVHYTSWLQFLVSRFTVNWLEILQQQAGARPLLDAFFLSGDPSQSLMVLSSALTQHSGYAVSKCASLLESFLNQGSLQTLFWQQCESELGHKGQQQQRRHQWQELVAVLISLPDKATSRLESECSDVFFPEQYSKRVAMDMLVTLERIHGNLAASKDVSAEFLSLLLGKLCITGYADRVWKALLPELLPRVTVDFVWCRVCERLILRVPDNSVESVLVPILQHCPWYGYVYKLLGQTVLTSNKVQFLLTNKLLLLRHFPQDLLLQNILGYLSYSPSTKSLLFKVLKRCLEVWGDRSAVKHTSYEQHQYLTRAVLVGLAFLSDKDKELIHQELVQKLLSGMQAHLDSSLPSVRRLGMVLGEAVTGLVSKPEMTPLKFEYEKDSEVERLQALLIPPADPQIEFLHSDFNSVSLKEQEKVSTVIETESTTKNVHKKEEELDSDDDLEPYDLSNDVEVKKVKPPVYVRECMEGLLNCEDADKVEVCLAAAEKLIHAHPKPVQEIAVEFALILLHLEDKFSLPGFLLQRLRALVALTTVSPAQVAEHLAQEFYERNYSLRQRMDILDVLATGAQELSQPQSKDKSKKAKISVSSPSKQTAECTEEDWRTVVQRRIDSKTRRFAHGPSQPQATPTPSRFAPVARNFFFPLTRHFDKQEQTLDLLGTDHLVLTRLVYTLGSITYSAIHAPVCPQIGTAMLEFIWVLRYHPQPSVRQALLYAVCMVLLAVPVHRLLGDLQPHVLDTKTWLQDVAGDDVDYECQKRAVQALTILDNHVRKEFNS